MSFPKGISVILLISLLFSCKSYYNEMIHWTDNLPEGLSVEEVRKILPDFLQTDWDHPETLDDEIHRYNVTEIKGNRDVLHMAHYLVFQDNQYIGRDSHK